MYKGENASEPCGEIITVLIAHSNFQDNRYLDSLLTDGWDGRELGLLVLGLVDAPGDHDAGLLVLGRCGPWR